MRAGKIEAAHVMSVTMSCDHRAVDGATAVRFTTFLAGRLSEMTPEE